MLVLSRKAGQTIQIGPDVTLTILGISGNTVRLGLDAPQQINIRRGELTVPLANGLPQEISPAATHTTAPRLELLSALHNASAAVTPVP